MIELFDSVFVSGFSFILVLRVGVGVVWCFVVCVVLCSICGLQVE